MTENIKLTKWDRVLNLRGNGIVFECDNVRFISIYDNCEIDSRFLIHFFGAGCRIPKEDLKILFMEAIAWIDGINND